jgi:hypothetical protein
VTSDPTQPLAPQFSAADDALLDAYLTHGVSLPDLAQAADNPAFSTRDLLAWISQPHIAAAVAQLHTLLADTAALRHDLARSDAITTLKQVCTTSPDETHRLRAALALALLARPRTPRPTDQSAQHTDTVRPANALPTTSPTSSSDPSDPSDLSDLFPSPSPSSLSPAPQPQPPADAHRPSAILQVFRDLTAEGLTPEGEHSPFEVHQRFLQAMEDRTGLSMSDPEVLKAFQRADLRTLDALMLQATGPPEARP